MQPKVETYTLLELNQLVKNTITEHFSSSFWVIAEISEVKEHYSGHCYLELIQKADNSDNIVARARATIWAYTYRMLKPYFESTTGKMLVPGMKILVKAQVFFHEVYGFSLNISDIEPTFTIGDLELKRRETINRLIADGVFDMNRELELEMLPNRIAVISSPQAAGYEDFVSQLTQNRFGYRFKITLFDAIMQGAEAEESIIYALDRIYKRANQFDLVAIVRGGGATADLSCFDSYNLASHVAQFPIPIATGIGHEKDSTITDLVAFKSVKTPTAVAEFIINVVNDAENIYLNLRDTLSRMASEKLNDIKIELLDFAYRLNNSCVLQMETEKNWLIKTTSALSSASKLKLYQSNLMITNAENQLKSHSITAIKNTITKLENMTKSLKSIYHQKFEVEIQKFSYIGKILETLNPINTLKKGFSITRINGKAIKSIKEIKSGDTLTTTFWDGQVTSRID